MTCTRSTSRCSRMRVLWVMTTSAPPVARRYASMPRDTTPSASTSRPESVSSRIASFGSSNSSCSISSLLLLAAETHAQLAVEIRRIHVQLVGQGAHVLLELLALELFAVAAGDGGAQEA